MDEANQRVKADLSNLMISGVHFSQQGHPACPGAGGADPPGMKPAKSRPQDLTIQPSLLLRADQVIQDSP